MFHPSKQFRFFLATVALSLLVLLASTAGAGDVAAAPAQAQQTAGAWVNAYALNVRSGPGVGYQVVDVVTRNQEVTVTHRAAGSEWVRVVTPANVTGWVNSYYLASNLKPFTFLPVWQGTPAPAPETAGAWVNTYALNVRSGPGVGYQVVDVVTRNQEVTVTHRAAGSDWVRITTPTNDTGWVNALYLASNLKPFNNVPVWDAGTTPPPAGQTVTAWVNTYALNVRSGPGNAFERVIAVPFNTRLTATHRAAGSGWVRVTTPGGLVGWVYPTYLAGNTQPFTVLPVWSQTATAPATTAPAQQTAEVALYWLDGEQLQAVPQVLPATDAPAEAALKALLAGPPEGYETAIPTPEEVAEFPGRENDWGDRVRLLSLSIKNGVATADFSEEMQAYGGGSARVQAIREQITQTLLQFPNIDEVRIAVAGKVETALQP